MHDYLKCPGQFSFMQSQTPECFHLSYLLSLYWKIVPLLHRHLMPMTQGIDIDIDIFGFTVN
eukprot:COSAG02_NODE_438_length_22319_cov_17.198425_7_plen_62_part_00